MARKKVSVGGAIAAGDDVTAPIGGKNAIEVKPPKFVYARFHLIGTSPLVVQRMSAKVKQQMVATQEEGSTSKTRKKREPKNFEKLYQDAKHISQEGWEGIHAAAIRSSMISVAIAAGAVKEAVKRAVIVIQEGMSEDGMTPLVRIHGKSEMFLQGQANTNGSMDIRSRPKYEKWECYPIIRYDADVIRLEDVANLLIRAGMTAGIGEGRYASRKANGIGWGAWRVDEAIEQLSADEIEELPAR